MRATEDDRYKKTIITTKQTYTVIFELEDFAKIWLISDNKAIEEIIGNFMRISFQRENKIDHELFENIKTQSGESNINTRSIRNVNARKISKSEGGQKAGKRHTRAHKKTNQRKTHARKFRK